MAYPGTYNFSYYKGDTYEFNVYPKDSAGTSFLLTNFTSLFTIAEARGAAGFLSQVDCYTSISADKTYITCAITPIDGELLVAGTQYVYDVQITDLDTPYDKVYTLITGTISVTDQVTGAEAQS